VEILDNAVKIKPRRQMSVQFSGGEPTMSPYFFDAIRYARKVRLQLGPAATNGIEFAKSKEVAKKRRRKPGNLAATVPICSVTASCTIAKQRTQMRNRR